MKKVQGLVIISGHYRPTTETVLERRFAIIDGLALVNEVKEVLIHMRFNSVLNLLNIKGDGNLDDYYFLYERS